MMRAAHKFKFSVTILEKYARAIYKAETSKMGVKDTAICLLYTTHMNTHGGHTRHTRAHRSYFFNLTKFIISTATVLQECCREIWIHTQYIISVFYSLLSLSSLLFIFYFILAPLI